MNKFYTIIAAILAALASFVSLFLFGKKLGADKQKHAAIKHNLEAANEFKKDNDAVSNMHDDDIRDELCKDARN